MTFDPKTALAKLRADYDWRGPGGKAQRHIVVPRKLVKLLLDTLDPSTPTAPEPEDDA